MTHTKDSVVWRLVRSNGQRTHEAYTTPSDAHQAAKRWLLVGEYRAVIVETAYQLGGAA